MRTNQNVTRRVLTLVLAGGEGRRLSPLTKYRPKPLVPFGGCHRIVDFTLSNCLNSGLHHVYMLTQHESDSVSAYLQKGWNRFGPSQFVFTKPPARGSCYTGTADAVLKNLRLLDWKKYEFVLILSADHVYRMDYRDLIASHVEHRADATIASVDRPREFCSEVGVLDVDDDDRVVGFEEKPPYSHFKSQKNGMISANMGVYVFNREVLLAAMTGAGRISDFGKDLIPSLIRSCDVCTYRHEDRITKTPLYWRDVGTPESYYASSMDLLASKPLMDPYDSDWPIRSADRAQFDGQDSLSEVGRRFEVKSIIAKGVNIGRASVYRSVLSPGVVLGTGAQVRNSVLMPGVVLERGATVDRAIIDANVLIEAHDEIGYDPQRDSRRFHVLSNGVVVVSPDHLSPLFSRDVIPSLSHATNA